MINNVSGCSGGFAAALGGLLGKSIAFSSFGGAGCAPTGQTVEIAIVQESKMQAAVEKIRLLDGPDRIASPLIITGLQQS
jgi:hypothetical protein